MSSSGCRGPAFVKAGVGCPIATGSYLSDASLVSSDGTCPRAKAHSFDHLSFDAQGAFVSPAAAILSCTTRQLGCALQVDCSALVLAVRLKFEGSLSEDAEALAGVATLSDPDPGCRSIVYDVEAERQAP